MTSISVMALTGLFAYTGLTGIPIEETPTVAAEGLIEPTYKTFTVAMTGYNAVPGQTDDTPEHTSIGAYTNPDIIAARSQDMADELPYGTVIAITAASSTPNCGLSLVTEQIGLRVIADAMNARMRNKVDILFDANKTVRAKGRQMNPALVFGICKKVQIAVVGRIDTKKMPKTQAELAVAVGLAAIAAR